MILVVLVHWLRRGGPPENFPVFRAPCGILLVMRVLSQVRVRIVILVVHVYLLRQDGPSQEHFAVFAAPCGTVLVMGSSPNVQLPPAPLVFACISVWTGLWRACCDDGFFDVLAANGAVERVVQGPVPMKCSAWGWQLIDRLFMSRERFFFWEPSMANNCWLSRARGCRGRWEFTPRRRGTLIRCRHTSCTPPDTTTFSPCAHPHPNPPLSPPSPSSPPPTPHTHTTHIHTTPHHTTPRHATPRHATPGQARPGHATPRHATPRHATPHHAPTTPHHHHHLIVRDMSYTSRLDHHHHHRMGYERHCGSGFELVLDVTVPQLGRELVEAPNVVSRVVEQNVHIPVRGGGRSKIPRGEFKVYAQDRVQHFSSSHPRRQCLNRLRQW